MPLQVTVVRSKRRKKTIQTKCANDHLWVYLPAGMSVREEEKWVSKMVERNQRWEQKHKVKKSDTWLFQRAQEFNKKFFNNDLSFSIVYVTNQNSRFGSCTSSDKTIRISDKVKTMPSWVQDYIIIHELTHLLYPDHSKQFWEKVNEYKYAERAKGYLIAISAGKIETEAEAPNVDAIAV
jgi:predicted metal-dependent hydrolase